MRLLAIEHVGDCLAFVRCQCGNEDQRSDSLVGTRRYHGAGIGVGCQDHGLIGAFEGAVERDDVIGQGTSVVLELRGYSALWKITAQ